MKKLLALILCVMMFVSVMSTSAFAAYDHSDQRTWAGESQNKKIVEALRTNLENIYGSYAVDNAVYKSVKGIDDMMKDMIDEMLKDYAPNINGSMTTSTALNDAILAGLRSTIGGEITDYIDKHQSDFYKTDSLGHRVFNPAAYAGVFSTAASKALTSGKAAAGIQAYMIYAADRAAFNTISQQAADLQSEILSWGHMGDYGWDDMTKGIHAWHTPGADMDSSFGNLDGVLHGIRYSYDQALTKLGQLGVDLNDDGQFGLGFNGWVVTADGTLVKSSADESERVNTALVTPLYSWLAVGNTGKTRLSQTGEVFEGTTGTYYVDTNKDGIADTIDSKGTMGGKVVGDEDAKTGYKYVDECTGETEYYDIKTPYFYWSGNDFVCCEENDVHTVESKCEVDSWIWDESNVSFPKTTTQEIDDTCSPATAEDFVWKTDWSYAH
jgi:hypothetical protein